ncbi:inositol monophosphatase family protein [Nocardia sp. NPDC059239]|uniref:inositol monophosphatase family protein n=1 Tax=Nocardia sp. NPDC059239 TaxID=3346785 RepID=UPI00368BCE97
MNGILAKTAEAARLAYIDALASHDRTALAEQVAMGADGTPTMRIDRIVEDAILAVVDGLPVNLLSEETGWLDRGYATTLVIDPLDGSANGAAGVPLTAFAGTLAVDGVFTESLTMWLDTGRSWAARKGQQTAYRTSGRKDLDGAAISLLRPHPHEPSAKAWWAVTQRAARIRVLSSSCLESALVAQGSTDGFLDAGTETHRLVDLAAASVMVPAAGGVVLDAHRRPITFDTDLTRRWSGVVAATPQLGEQLLDLLQMTLPAGHVST